VAAPVGRPLSGTLTRSQRPLISGAATALLLSAVLPPLAWPLVDLISSTDVGVLSTLLRGSTLILLARSLALAAAVALLATALGLSLSLLLTRSDLPGRGVLIWLHGFPLFLPPLLLALGWFHLLGREGLLGSAASSRLLFSPVGVVGVLVLAFSPVATFLCTLALRGVDPALVEAARLGRGGVLRVVLPAIRPAALVAAIVIFSLALSELGVPNFLRVAVYPAAVFAWLGGVDFRPGEAALLAAPLLLVALLLVYLERRALRGRSFAVLGLRQHQRVALAPPGQGQLPTTLAALLAAAAALAPLAALLHVAVARGGLGELLTWIDDSLWVSLTTAAAGATTVTAVAVVLGHGLCRRRHEAVVMDTLSVAAFLVPAAVLGVGLIAIWTPTPLYGGLGIIVVGYVARYATVGIRAVAAAMAQSNPNLEQAAAAFGGSYLRRMTRIVVPLHRRGVGGAWLMTFVFCLRDLETAVLYYPPGGETLTVRIFTLEANGPPGVIAGLCLVQVALTAVAALGGAALLRDKVKGGR
jgi:iron(III) transport system permease protein